MRKVTFENGDVGQVKVGYRFNGNQPYFTWVQLELDGFILTGESRVRPPDQFSYLRGRKYALINMFRMDDAGAFGPEKILSKKDRETLFRNVCPQYFEGKKHEALKNPVVQKNYWRDFHEEINREKKEEKPKYKGLFARIWECMTY